MTTVLYRRGRFSLVFEPRDLWIGFYIGKDAVYAVLVPTLAFRWSRRLG